MGSTIAGMRGLSFGQMRSFISPSEEGTGADPPIKALVGHWLGLCTEVKEPASLAEGSGTSREENEINRKRLLSTAVAKPLIQTL